VPDKHGFDRPIREQQIDAARDPEGTFRFGRSEFEPIAPRVVEMMAFGASGQSVGPVLDTRNG
jgi:hypothetical protein